MGKSSSYEHGDCGGAHGAYEHAVSAEWVKEKVTAARSSVKAPRRKQFSKRMEKLDDRMFKKSTSSLATWSGAKGQKSAWANKMRGKAKAAKQAI